MKKDYNLITILGPTASGKTNFATALAYELDTCIISADSRQVYKGMDIGTGKDLEEYQVNGKRIDAHLLDICQAGEKYNLFRFQEDFFEVFDSLNGNTPIMCGGSGLYVEAIVDNYNLKDVPQNPKLREELEELSFDELASRLKNLRKLHNKTDLDNKKRIIRAIEIEEYSQNADLIQTSKTKINSLTIGVDIDRELRREKISRRLNERLENGMVQEVENLLKTVSAENLIYYGLEYKYLTLYLIGELSFQEMHDKLEIEIHKFAKRQMTFFRKMERKGINIHWLDAQLSNKDKILKILELL